MGDTVQEAVIECTRCKNQMRVLTPDVKVINDRAYSLVMVVHENTSRCPSCGTEYVPVIAELGNISYAWMPVPPKSQIIQPPAGVKFPV